MGSWPLRDDPTPHSAPATPLPPAARTDAGDARRQGTPSTSVEVSAGVADPNHQDRPRQSHRGLSNGRVACDGVPTAAAAHQMDTVAHARTDSTALRRGVLLCSRTAVLRDTLSCDHPPNLAKKSQQFGRTIQRAYFSAKCFPVTRIMALAPQTHCPFGCCVVRDMWKPLLAEKRFASCCFYKTKNGICTAKMIG